MSGRNAGAIVPNVEATGRSGARALKAAVIVQSVNTVRAVVITIIIITATIIITTETNSSKQEE
jgi:hypothetical protein